MSLTQETLAQSEEFEILQERPPSSLFRRFLTTVFNLSGLLCGGGFAYLRAKKAQGRPYGIQYWLLRFVLLFARPFLDGKLIALPFPVQFRLRLEHLGPTYIKLGQILSLRQDVLPRALTDELQNLLDRLPVVPFERFLELVDAELDIPLEEAFAWIDPVPLGSASLAQTHRARLMTDDEVVLKVLKPGVIETVEQDCKLLRGVGFVLQQFLSRYQPKRLIDEFSNYTLREIDLRFEADNADTFAANFKDQVDVKFPVIYRAFSGRTVLCMEFFSGMKPSAAVIETLTTNERQRILDLGVGSIMRMVFRDGFFHADLHPGNLILFPDGHIGFIDLGMVGRLDERTRKGMLYYFYSLFMGDAVNAARTLTSVAMIGDESEPDEFRREVESLNERWIKASGFDTFSIAQLVLSSVSMAGRYRIYYPEAIILMVKALVTVEGVGHMLDPQMKITVVAGKHIRGILLSQFDPRRLFKQSLIIGPELIELVLRSPVILSESVQRMEQQRVSNHRGRQLAGLKEIALAGFCLLAGTIVGTQGGPWPVWVGLTAAAIVLALLGLR